MRYNLKGDDYVRGGHIDLELIPIEDIYEIKYSAFFNLWKKVETKVFGRKITNWIPLPNYETSGSVRVPKSLLSEAFLKSDHEFEHAGVRFSPLGGGRYSFNKKQVSGEIQLSFDGCDPVEIASFVARYDGKTIEGRP